MYVILSCEVQLYTDYTRVLTGHLTNQGDRRMKKTLLCVFVFCIVGLSGCLPQGYYDRKYDDIIAIGMAMERTHDSLLWSVAEVGADVYWSEMSVEVHKRVIHSMRAMRSEYGSTYHALGNRIRAVAQLEASDSDCIQALLVARLRQGNSKKMDDVFLSTLLGQRLGLMSYFTNSM